MTTALEVEHHFPRRPPPPHRPPPSICDLHPYEAVTGFCASCLRERLSGLEASANSATVPGRRSTSAIKSVFSKASGGGGGGPLPPLGPSSSFLRPELRRCRSFSFARSDGFSGPRVSTSSSSAFEPQRRSCDFRSRNTLPSLFHQKDRSRPRDPSRSRFSSMATAERVIEAERRNLGFQGTAFLAPPVVEAYDVGENGPLEPVLVVGTSGELEVGGNQILVEAAELKPMKDHINLDAQRQQKQKKQPAKDLKEIAGNFLLAASVFGKKLQRWGRKQKPKKPVSKAAAAAMPVQNVQKSSRRCRDTQSEIAVDTFGRRSWDTDPRFSLDVGRMSLDDPRYSMDEPRASCDGYQIGGRPVFPRLHPMLSVVEDDHAQAIPRSDGLIPVEEDVIIPGGTMQTRNYYLDSSSRRRRSLDRSSSMREQPIEITEPRSIFNTKVAPAGSAELFHFHHGSSLDQGLKNWSSNSLRDNYSGSFESVFGDSHKGTDTKKTRRWTNAWNLWDLIQRRHGSKSRPNMVDGSFSESWPEFQTELYNRKFLRSNSAVSSKSYSSVNGAYGSMRKAHIEVNGQGKKTDQFMLEGNPSARQSTGRGDNDTIRLYSTAMWNSRRMGNSLNGSQVSSQYTRTMPGLY